MTPTTRLPDTSPRNTLCRSGFVSPRTSKACPLPPPRQPLSVSTSASGSPRCFQNLTALPSDRNTEKTVRVPKPRSLVSVAHRSGVSLSPTLCRWNLLTSSGKCRAFQVLCVGCVLVHVYVSVPSTNVAVSPRPVEAQRAVSVCLRPAKPRSASRPVHLPRSRSFVLALSSSLPEDPHGLAEDSTPLGGQ